MNKKRLLYVEDQLIIAKSFMKSANENGFDVKHFRNCDSALEHFEENVGAYDGFVLDFDLPDGTGVGLYEAFNQIAFAKGKTLPPALFISGNSRPDIEDPLRDKGFGGGIDNGSIQIITKEETRNKAFPTLKAMLTQG